MVLGNPQAAGWRGESPPPRTRVLNLPVEEPQKVQEHPQNFINYACLSVLLGEGARGFSSGFQKPTALEG